ncbi:MAG: hypothetical protein ABSG49_03660 [Methanoregula sp.]|uniref:hypothetical protein n=1 Tax=Methanoregula sp. TaxID=2052170 RepID=UPI003C2AA57E
MLAQELLHIIDLNNKHIDVLHKSTQILAGDVDLMPIRGEDCFCKTPGSSCFPYGILGMRIASRKPMLHV